MREILFKAKRISDGNWIEGSLIVYPDQTTGIVYDIGDIEGMRKEVVRPETVCQYTGLADKNGKKIFEGDVVRLVYDGEEYIFVVIWDQDELDFKATNGKQNYGPGGFQYLPCCDEIEILGSIHDGEGGQHEQ